MEGASITLAHTYHVPAYLFPEGIVVGGADIRSDILARIEANLRAERERAHRAGVPTIEVELTEGTPYVEIVKLACQGDFDLIVMGTHGYTGIKHVLLGSVAEKVVRKAPCAVFVVRRGDQSPEPMSSQ
jgi:nucleotide-binding universal stress UspA family protein